MSNFPFSIDDDSTLPPVNDNLTEQGEEAINGVRDAVFNIENNIGIGAAGTTGSIANRLNQALNPDGTIRASAFSSLDPAVITAISQSLVVTDNQILPYSISENKINLAVSTQTLFNYTQDNARSTNIALGWIDTSGVKLEPHLAGVLYRHTLDEIDIPLSLGYLKNRFGLFRNNTNSYTALNDLNSDFVAHEVSDGTVAGSVANVTTPSGIIFPSAFAHSGTGVYIDPTIFAIIPQTVNNIQLLAEYIDSANILLLGTKTQTLFQSGIPRASRATVIGSNSKGPEVVPPTAATTFLSTTIPQDSPFSPFGDDIIQFTPPSSITSDVFQSYLNSVNVGDVATVNYGSVVATFLVKEINAFEFTVRIAGKNLVSTTTASVDISRSLDNFNKYGVLAPSVVAAPSGLPSSLVIASPRGAQTTGIGFNPTQFDTSHYNLYLALYPSGNPTGTIVNLVAIDVTGNQGATPGAYTLDSIVQITNSTLRKAGYNFRFTAFEYEGEFGIMIADSYNAASFSIIAGVINAVTGQYDSGLTTTVYPNNVVDVINLVDPLGFGPNGNNVASPPFSSLSITTAAASLFPTVIINPLQRNFYYVNGAESDRFAVQPSQLLDVNGDSYWPATISSKSVTGSTVQVTYQVNYDLSTSNLQKGKTLVVQPAVLGTGYSTDFGRFIIQSVQFVSTCTSDGYVYSTNITVYDAVHGTGSSPYLTSNVGLAVSLYFGEDSVAFNIQNANDILERTNTFPFKRSFEIYIDQNGSTFSHERARLSLNTTILNRDLPNQNPPGGTVNDVQFFVGNGTISNSLFNTLNIVEVSPKLTGYNSTNGAEGVTVTKINFQLVSNPSLPVGTYQGYLRNYSLTNGETYAGPLTTFKNGEVTRFYDSTFIDYIDLELDFGSTVSLGTDGYGMDIQLYPSLRGRDDILLLATCQYNDASNQIAWLKDQRQFGNISEKELSDSALSFIGATARYTQQNGVVRGFNCVTSNNVSPFTTTSSNNLSFSGGLALVNGSFIAVNPFDLEIPIAQDAAGGTPSGVLFAACINSNSEIVLISLTDYNASINSINNPGRLVNLTDLSTNQTYAVDSSVFSTIINDRKDLTILYLISMVATSASAYTITINDARKYVTDSNANSYMVLTSGDSQGNFNTFGAISTWSYYNKSYQSNVLVRGNFTLTVDPALISGFTYTGDGYASSITFSATSGLTTVSGVTFNNLILNVNVVLTVVDCTFNNCTINLGSGGSIDPSTFTNCTINLVQSVTVNAATFNGCNINVGYNGVTNVATKLATGLLLAPNANGVTLHKCNVMYYPNLLGSGYSSSNLINSVNGALYCNVSALQNITIDDCTFASSAASNARFPFVSFEYNTSSTYAQGIRISNNKFYNTSATDDTCAVIAFTSTQTSAQPTEGLKLINCVIDNNTCDKNQLIAITGALTTTLGAVNCAIVPVGLTITGNLCGAISVTGAADLDRNYETLTTGLAYGKGFGATISRNTCKYIGMLSSTGLSLYYQYNDTAAVSAINVQTCSLNVDSNQCAWIHLVPNANVDGYSASLPSPLPYQQNSVVRVNNNSLRAFNPAFLTTYGETTSDSIAIALIPGGGTNSTVSTGNSTIQSNTIMQGAYLTSSMTTQTYDYVSCVKIGFNSIISSNIFANLQASGDMITTHAYTNSQLYVSITNNQFYRNLVSLNSYINVGSNGTYMIADNFFDSTTTNGTSTTLVAGTLTNVPVNVNNVNYSPLVTTYNYPANSNITYGANSTLTFDTGTKLVSAVSLNKNRVQPFSVTQVAGSVTLTDVPVIAAGTGNILYIKLTDMINGATCGSGSILLNAISGTANGDNTVVQYTINNNTGAVTTVGTFGLFRGGERGLNGEGLGGFGLIDTTQFTYMLSITGDSGTTTGIYAPIFNFTYTQMLPSP